MIGLEFDGALLSERRRPGRREDVAQVLLPFLRGDGPTTRPVVLPPEPDPLAPARGIGLGLVISGGMWWGIACMARWLWT